MILGRRGKRLRTDGADMGWLVARIGGLKRAAAD